MHDAGAREEGRLSVSHSSPFLLEALPATTAPLSSDTLALNSQPSTVNPEQLDDPQQGLRFGTWLSRSQVPKPYPWLSRSGQHSESLEGLSRSQVGKYVSLGVSQEKCDLLRNTHPKLQP